VISGFKKDEAWRKSNIVKQIEWTGGKRAGERSTLYASGAKDRELDVSGS